MLVGGTNLGNGYVSIIADFVLDLYVGSNSTVAATNFTSGTNSYGNTYVGYTTDSSNNTLTVGNSGTTLSLQNTTYLGYTGASNSLIISNGGVLSDNYAYIGHSNSSSNNSAVVTGSGSLWTNSGDLTVGDLGSGNSLTISNSAKVVSVNGVIGNQSSASNNSVVVTGAGSSWSNSGLLFIGAGAGNSLTASNGGVVTATYLGIQQGAGTGSNTVTITGSNSQALISGVVEIGSTASNSGAALIISAGGSLTNGGNAVVGTTNGAAQGNSVLITDSNSTWKVGGNFNFGNGSGGNTLVISNGATLANSNGYIGIYGGSSNSATVTANSLWSNSADFYVGYNGGSNSLIISGSSTLTDRRGYLGYTNSDSNSALVTDAGSTWINTNGIVVGYYSSGNSLTVSNAASVVSSNKVTLGYTASSSNNSIVVTAGGSINDGTTDLNVGRAGSGNTLTISGGGTVTDGNAYLGATNTSSNNFVLVTDSNSVFSSSQNLNIGYGGTGSLTISNSAKVVDLGAYIGNQSNSVGSVNVNAATWSNAGYLEVGVNGSGSLSISGGGTVTDSNGIIGNAGGSSGAVTVTGSGSLWTNSGSLIVGDYGTGSLTISGGTVYDPNGYIGYSTSSNGATGSVTMNGGLWSNSSSVAIGNGGVGNLTLGGNGTLSAASGVTIASQVGSVGALNIGSLGGSDAAAGISLVTPSITFGSGSGTINFNQADTFTLSIPVSGPGSLQQLGSGTTIISGSNSYTGTTLIAGGTLVAVSTNALGTGSVTLGGGISATLNLTTNVTVGSFTWDSNGVIAMTPGQQHLFINAAFINGLGTNSVDAFNFGGVTLMNTNPVTLITFGTNSGFNTNDFSVVGSTNWDFVLTSSNLEVVYLGNFNSGLIASNTVTTVAGTQTNISVTFQPEGVLNITPSGNLTITTGVSATNNGRVILDGKLTTSLLTIPKGGSLTGNGGTLNGNLTIKTGGAFILMASSSTQYSHLGVNGSITLGGTLIVEGINGYPLNFGDKYTFLTTTNSINGNFDAIDIPAPYRARIIIAGDPTASVLIAPESYTQLAASPNQYQVAKALDSFIPATSGDQLVVSTTLDSLTASQYQAAFNAIAPSIYQSESTIAFNLANAQNQELLQRLWGVRVAGTGFSMSGFADNTMVVEGQGDGGKGVLDSKKDILRPGADNHWGMFVDGNGIFATANSGNMLPNYNSQSGGVTTGMTYKWNDSFGTGIYAGYEGSYAKYNGGSTLIDNSVRFGLFGTYGHPDGKGFYADGLIGGGYNNYQVSRNISFGTLNRTANSTPGAGELDSMLAGGYDIKKGNWTYGPTTSLQYTYFGANPVNETGAQSLDFNSSGWNTSSLLYSLGAHVAYSWQANKDVLVVPQISLSWQHEFLQSPYSVNGSLGGSPTFSNTSATPIRDTLYTGVGFTVELYKKWNTSLFYNASAGNSDLTSQNIFWSAGVKF